MFIDKTNYIFNLIKNCIKCYSQCLLQYGYAGTFCISFSENNPLQSGVFSGFIAAEDSA